VFGSAVVKIKFDKIDFDIIDFGQKWVECKLIYVWLHWCESDSNKIVLFG